MWAFESWRDFWYMGGYASYVWPAITITLIVLKSLLWYVVVKHRKVKQQLMAILLQREI